MSMSIGNLFASPGEATSHSQRRKDFESLVKALDGGDLEAAQKAMETLQKKAPGAARGQGPLADLAQALKAADLDDAQKALAALRSRRGPHLLPDSRPEAPLARRPGPNGTGQLLNEVA